MAKPIPKFVQITACDSSDRTTTGLFALDEAGDVYEYDWSTSVWWRKPRTRDEDDNV